MAFFTSLALAGVGAYLQYQGAKDQAAASQRAYRAQNRAERVREEQMNLDATRRKREVIRQQQLSRALAQSAATNQNAQFGSGLPGGYGQISGRTGVNLLGISQNQELGSEIFAANRAATRAYSDYAAAGSTASLGAGLSSLGNVLMSNYGTLNSIFGGFGSSTMLSQYGAGTAGSNKIVGGYYFG